VNMDMYFRVPQNTLKFMSGCTIGSFSRRVQLHERVTDLGLRLLNRSSDDNPLACEESYDCHLQRVRNECLAFLLFSDIPQSLKSH
jgi:hypothetical protein